VHIGASSDDASERAHEFLGDELQLTVVVARHCAAGYADKPLCPIGDGPSHVGASFLIRTRLLSSESFGARYYAVSTYSHRFQIPVRIVDVHMAEIRGEERQQRVDGAAGPIALDERPDRESMS
jgi:hypothetical protein